MAHVKTSISSLLPLTRLKGMGVTTPHWRKYSLVNLSAAVGLKNTALQGRMSNSLIRHNLQHSSVVIPRRYYAQKSDDPIPFLQSDARKFKVDNVYSVEPEDRHRQRYALPLGFTLFGVVMYFGFIRKYGESDKAVMDSLTGNIRKKLPEDARQRINFYIGEENCSNSDTDQKDNGEKN